jgi:mono/diheme cytochrome c family protein
MTQAGRRRPLTVLLAFWLLSVSGAEVADPAGLPIVPGFERFCAATADSGRGGQLLLGELNCAGCHDPGDRPIDYRQAPVLDNVAGRVRIGYLRKFLRNPQAVKTGTTMPDLLVGDPDGGQKVEALVHFLASTGVLRHRRPDPGSVAPGRDLYHKVGCVACHGTRDAAGDQDIVSPASVPLGDLKTKYSVASLSAFLEDPLRARPSGRMPKLLDGKEARAVATYLLQGARVSLHGGRGTTAFAYFEGSWDKLPEFDRLKPSATGVGPAFDLGAARRGVHYGLRFDGYCKVDREADYDFTLTSDDGSRLLVDGKRVVDNDGLHGFEAKNGAVKLTPGSHKVTVEFFQADGGAALSVEVAAPGFGHHDLSDLVAATEAAPDRMPAHNDPEDALEFKPALVEKGQALFTGLGCANCHTMHVGKKLLAPTLTAPPLSGLRTNGGCLSATPARGAPWYSLSVRQRDALAAAVKEPPQRGRTPGEFITNTMTAFNCYACHVRDKGGGPAEELNRFFQTTQPEMGDEGRLPPPLDGVGAKLTAQYLKQLLEKGAHDRPTLHTRMPGFGAENLSPLVEAFAAADMIEMAPAVTFREPPGRVKAQGRHLAGGQALGCVTCHTFAGHKAGGVQGIDLTLMPRRLRRDWFHAYVADPQRLRPGTRMPAAFVKGKSVLPEVLDGTAATQIEALWLYLSDGDRAAPPAGASPRSIPLVPAGGAIVYRNFIEGAGARAIAVGYTEKSHLAFDADKMRLALLWQGAFLDAARHWTDRGIGFEGPLGDNVLRLHDGVPFATLEKADNPWPTAPAREQGYRFRGYRLTPDDRPTFCYSLGDVKVEDFPEPAGGNEPSLRRTLFLTAPGPVENLSFRAAVGDRIETLGEGCYRIEGTWRLRLQGAALPQVRQSAGKAELLVPIRFADGKARLVEEFEW